MKTHFTWNIETHDGKCRKCKRVTRLISASSFWHAHEHDGEDKLPDEFRDGVEVNDEITAHYCPKCDTLTALSLNTRK